MVIDGESFKDEWFFDDTTKKNVLVTLKVKEIIFFRLLEKIIGALAK